MNPKKHGGKRAGAGRPPKFDHPVVVRATIEAAEKAQLDAYLERAGLSQSELIRALILSEIFDI